MVLKIEICSILFRKDKLNLVVSRRWLLALSFIFRLEFKTFFGLDLSKWNKIFDSQHNSNFGLFEDSDTKVVRWFKDERVDLLFDSLIIGKVRGLLATCRRLKLID